jgi:hypothetical protein
MYQVTEFAVWKSTRRLKRMAERGRPQPKSKGKGQKAKHWFATQGLVSPVGKYDALQH